MTACSSILGETPTPTGTPSSGTATTSHEPDDDERECVRITGGTGAINTGTVAGDALFLSGETFVCADDVVVADPTDLNVLAVAAQLAAAVEGPLLLPHPQLAAEVGRLKPKRVHILGEVALTTPPGSVVETHDLAGAVRMVGDILGLDRRVSLPSNPGTTTVVDTVNAIVARDRVAVPEPSTTATSPTPPATVDPDDVIGGITVAPGGDSLWVVDAEDPVVLLLASAIGQTTGASVVGVDLDDLFEHPEVSDVIGGYAPETIRLIGEDPGAFEWELAVLANGHELPGGGFYILPPDAKRRYLAFYGHPESEALGALGQQGPEETLERMEPLLEAYSADGSQVVPTFEMIASVAAASATDDGDYSFEWPIDTFEPWIEVARDNDVYVILDLQPGRDDFLTQAKLYQDLLELPFVGLALDPEWRLAPDQVHLRQVGRVDAAEVNQVIDWLADLVRDRGLPQKMLIVHQFRLSMIQNRDALEQRDEIQLIIQMDGEGSEPQKDDTYEVLNRGAEDAFWAWGWKNFFVRDVPGPPTPESTMGKEPSPVYVSYQ